MSPEMLVAIFGSAGLAGLLGAVVTALANRRKLGADATKIITDAASGVAKTFSEDNVRLRAQVISLEERLTKTEKQRYREREAMRRMLDEHTAILQAHAAWDMIAVTRLHDAGIVDLPQPPAMYPPDAKPSDLRSMLGGDDDDA